MKQQTYYRVSSELYLPTHWSYLDGWEMVDGEWVDNRQPGFQVWGRSEHLVAGLCGADYDCDFSEALHVLLVDVGGPVGDGCGVWYAVQPGAVRGVREVSVADFRAWVASQLDEEEELDEEDWVRANVEACYQWLDGHAVPVDGIEWRDTMPFPG